MNSSNQVVMMTIYLSSTDKFRSSLLYEAITIEAKNFGVKGATVFRGIIGYGASSKNLTTRFWELAGKDPITIQLIDDRAKLDRFMHHLEPWFDEADKGYMVTLSPVEIVLTREGRKAQS